MQLNFVLFMCKKNNSYEYDDKKENVNPLTMLDASPAPGADLLGLASMYTPVEIHLSICPDISFSGVALRRSRNSRISDSFPLMPVEGTDLPRSVSAVM